MPTADQTSRGLRVAVTGAGGDVGRLLLPRLEGDPRVERILVLDLDRPAGGAKLDFHRVDLTRPDADQELTDALAERPVDALYHLAFLSRPARQGSLAHELEVVGSMKVLAAVSQLDIPRLIVSSLTALYGARSQNPALLREDAPLTGCPESRYVNDKIEVENQVRAFAERHPQRKVVVLRFAPLFGPGQDNPATRLLRGPIVPTLLGFDPLWQALHEADAGRALHQALHAQVSGEFNIVGEGVMPLSGMIREMGAYPLPLPQRLAHGALRAMAGIGAGIPAPLLDYVHFSWVADGSRARKELGFVPDFTARDAVAAMRRS